jgi:hypothetical protein
MLAIPRNALRASGQRLPATKKQMPRPTIVTAYLDESEDENRPRKDSVSAIGGLVGNVDNWRGFASEWRSVMDSHGLVGVRFHTVDFENAFKEPWKSLKTDAERRKSLLNGLLEVIQRNFVFPYGVFALVGEYDALEDRAKKKWSTPYKLCFDQVILYLFELLALNPGDRVQCVFDDNEKYRGWAQKYYQQLVDEFPQYRGILMENVQFTSRRESAEMEAADLFAYEMRKAVYNGLQDPSRSLRYGFSELIRPGQGIWRIDFSQVIQEDRRIYLANEDR